MALDPTLDIAEGTLPVASAIDIWVRDPSAVSSLPARAHNWTCDRAIIALEHDLPFSSAEFFSSSKKSMMKFVHDAEANLSEIIEINLFVTNKMCLSCIRAIRAQ